MPSCAALGCALLPLLCALHRQLCTWSALPAAASGGSPAANLLLLLSCLSNAPLPAHVPTRSYSLSRISDVRGLRIIVESKADCYRALRAVEVRCCPLGVR